MDLIALTFTLLRIFSLHLVNIVLLFLVTSLFIGMFAILNTRYMAFMLMLFWACAENVAYFAALITVCVLEVTFVLRMISSQTVEAGRYLRGDLLAWCLRLW